ncbi:MAG: sulfotransferase [Candidatus Thermoplasmatota archaeon]|nr:sulfotransferase [Candidatus Thermoplasmatota archaeon]MBU1941904.1 sulfotransferase [Candidatus Thermoplasmatota archaeon]
MISNLKTRWKKHTLLDALIYHTSHKMKTYDTLRFNLWINRQRPHYISTGAPILIGGCPRSGTTLARALLSVHPQIASPEQEFNLLMWITQDTILKNILELTNQELTDLRDHHTDLIDRAETILTYYQHHQNKPRVALKHPHHVAILPRLYHHFPNLKFIHMLRDGRDTVCSLRTHPKRHIQNGKIIPNTTRNPFPWCVRQWVSYVLQGQQWQNTPNYLEIRYEDLVNNTIPTMQTIFTFLHLPPVTSQELLGFYKKEKGDHHLQNIEVGQPIYQKTLGRWQKDMTLREQHHFKHMAGDLLIKLGYVTTNDW